MTLRKVIFWIHLVTGISAGLVILIMSLTGVLLAYEKQILAWSDRSSIEASPAGADRLPLETLVTAAKDANSGVMPSSITFYSQSGAMQAATSGSTIYVDSHTGKVIGSGTAVNFFRFVRTWHRYFGMTGGNKDLGGSITGAATIVAVLLTIAGLYLWLPRRTLWFKPGLKGKARNWNWHNVFGFWAAVPLLVVLVSGVVISYDWATNLVYRASGSELPAANTIKPDTSDYPGKLAKLDPFIGLAERQTPEWKMVTLKLPVANNLPVNIAIDRGNGGMPQLKSTLTVDQGTGAVVKWEQFQDQTSGRQARNWFRYAHTGEFYGVPGQTIAGLGAVAAVMMVWTGFALWLKRVAAWMKVRSARAKNPRVGAGVRVDEADAA